jgi:putative ABC transport system permease protein
MRGLFPLKGENTEDAISFLNYRPNTPAQHLQAKLELHEIIARRHGFDPKLEDSFGDWDTIENNQKVGKIFSAMDWFLGVVGVVTLGLGAIGIINIMLVCARRWAQPIAPSSPSFLSKERFLRRSAAA